MAASAALQMTLLGFVSAHHTWPSASVPPWNTPPRSATTRKY